jgi:hypothetical protein
MHPIPVVAAHSMNNRAAQTPTTLRVLSRLIKLLFDLVISHLVCLRVYYHEGFLRVCQHFNKHLVRIHKSDLDVNQE